MSANINIDALWKKNYNIVKQDLEHYYNALQDKYDYYKTFCYDELLIRCKHLENLEKAIRILNHHFTIEKLKVANGYLYFLNIGDINFGISKEEFELLERIKKVLNNDK